MKLFLLPASKDTASPRFYERTRLFLENGTEIEDLISIADTSRPSTRDGVMAVTIEFYVDKVVLIDAPPPKQDSPKLPHNRPRKSRPKAA